MRFNLPNSQNQIFDAPWDPPSLLPPNSIPAQETRSMFAPAALGSGQLRVILHPVHAGGARPKAAAVPCMHPAGHPRCSLQPSPARCSCLPSLTRGCPGVSVPAQSSGTGEHGGAAVSAGYQSAAGGLQPGGGDQQPVLPQTGQHHQSLRGHGEPGPTSFGNGGRRGQPMGELLSASLPQFPHLPHRRGGRGQLQGWFKRGAEEWGWMPGPLQRGAGGAQSRSVKR